MLRPALATLVLLAGTALADVPARHVVAGVPEGDVLNVRASPSAASADIGDLDNGDAVEVLVTRDGWGRIVHGEGNGWVSLRYLRPSETPDRVTFTEPGPDGISEDRARVAWAGAASGRAGFPAALRAEGTDADYTLVMRPAMCGDGMSDRDYGWMAEVLTGDRLLAGCCRLDTRD